MVAKKNSKGGPKLVEMPQAERFSLTVKERILLPTLLPTRGTFFMLKQFRQFVESLSFSEKEIALLELRPKDSGGMAWKIEGEKKVGLKSISFPDSILQLTRKELKRLDTEEKLTDELCSLYEKLMPPSEEDPA